jgi:TRAP-type C4-dicarboxylate transport system substrate-binding protein
MEVEMKKLSWLTISCFLIFVVISILLPACAQEKTTSAPAAPAPAATTTQAPVQPIEIKYATFRPPTDPQSVAWLIPMCNEIEKRTGGKVTVKIYYSEALGKSTDQYSLVKDGIADMTDFAGSWVPGKFVLSDVGNLPFAAQNAANLLKAMYTLYNEGYFDSQYNEVEFLAWTSTTPYKFLFRNKQPTTFAELSGLKARAPGGVANEALAAIGMVPVNVAPGDAYTAWQTGLVDVWVHPAGAVTKYKLNELPTKALLDIGFFCTSNAGNIFNKKKFASLSPDIQKTIRDVVQEYSTVYLQSGIDTENDAMKVIKDSGIEVYTFNDTEMAKLTAAAAPIWQKYTSDLEAKGLPGKKMVSEFIKILESLGEKPPALP